MKSKLSTKSEEFPETNILKIGDLIVIPSSMDSYEVLGIVDGDCLIRIKRDERGRWRGPSMFILSKTIKRNWEHSKRNIDFDKLIIGGEYMWTNVYYRVLDPLTIELDIVNKEIWKS